jgi:RimJ/RimL family protein N-acetyltransferase
VIETDHLHLIPCEPGHIAALLRSRQDLADLLQVTLPDGWPHFPEAFSPETADRLQAAPAVPWWYSYFFIHSQTRALVGSGGFAGPPDADGVVEIGYEIAPEHQHRGYATAAAQALISDAFSHAAVTAVIAHKLAEPNASNRVLQKVGLAFEQTMDDPEHGTIWRWRIQRSGAPPS